MNAANHASLAARCASLEAEVSRLRRRQSKASWILVGALALLVASSAMPREPEDLVARSLTIVSDGVPRVRIGEFQRTSGRTSEGVGTRYFTEDGKKPRLDVGCLADPLAGNEVGMRGYDEDAKSVFSVAATIVKGRPIGTVDLGPNCVMLQGSEAWGTHLILLATGGEEVDEKGKGWNAARYSVNGHGYCRVTPGEDDDR